MTNRPALHYASQTLKFRRQTRPQSDQKNQSHRDGNSNSANTSQEIRIWSRGEASRQQRNLQPPYSLLRKQAVLSALFSRYQTQQTFQATKVIIGHLTFVIRP